MNTPAVSDPTPAPAPTHDAKGRRLWRAGTLVYTTGGLITLFCWLLWGDFAWMLKERSAIPVTQLVLKRFEASDMLVGLLVGSLPAALGMILGPLVSVRSDRHRGRWGRRIPYLLIPTPIAALSMAGLAFTPRLGAWLHAWLGESSPGLNASVLLAFALFWVVFEIATNIANAVLGGLINDVVPREVIGRFFALFRAVSLIAGIIFNDYIIGYAEEHYYWIFIGVGLLYGGGFTLMCLAVKEGEYPPPPPRSPDIRSGPLAGIIAYARECFTSPYYLWLFGATTLAQLAFGPVNTFSVFYAKSLDMSMETYGSYLAFSFKVSLVLSFFLGWLADKFHPLRLGIVSIALYAILATWAGLHADTQRSFAFAFVAHTILSGIYFTATASIGQRLYPAIAFAQFASAAGLLNALCFALLPPLVGKILDLSGHAYQLTFIFGSLFAMASLVGFMVVHRHFMRLGGPKNYAAPLWTDPSTTSR